MSAQAPPLECPLKVKDQPSARGQLAGESPILPRAWLSQGVQIGDRAIDRSDAELFDDQPREAVVALGRLGFPAQPIG